MDIGDRIYALRKRMGLTLEDLGALVGVGKSTVRKWETGYIKNMRRDKIALLASALHTTPAYLMGWEDDIPSGFEPIPSLVHLPVVGTIACGEPILAEENIEGWLDVPVTVHADFILRCKGDSMIDARIHDGDIVFIRRQPEVENGEIAAVRIGDECTLKRFQKSGDTVILLPCNSAYQPMIFQGRELEDIRIEGKLVGFMSYDVR